MGVGGTRPERSAGRGGRSRRGGGAGEREGEA